MLTLFEGPSLAVHKNVTLYVREMTSTFSRGDVVRYVKGTNESVAKIVEVHFDDCIPYYTIETDGRIVGTTGSSLLHTRRSLPVYRQSARRTTNVRRCPSDSRSRLNIF